MKTTKEMIEIMKAYDEGKKIEYKYLDTEKWFVTGNPSWSWSVFDYRIKPEIEYMTCEEIFEKLQKQGVMAIKSKNRNKVVTVSEIDFERQEIITVGVTIYDYPKRHLSYGIYNVRNLYLNYTFLDGSEFIKEN